jgi:hypothetical protein
MLLPLIVSAVIQTSPKVEVSLSFAKGVFTTSVNKDTQRTPISAKPTKVQEVFALKVDKNWIVWDKRGLTIRTPKQIATSGKVLTKEQISENVTLFASKTRSKYASSLSGDEFVGDRLFLVPRWTDANGKPWLEALIEINLADKEPWPKLVGKVNGVSRATGTVADELFLMRGQLNLLVENLDTWGLATWDLAQNFGQYKQLGTNLVRVSNKWEESAIAFVERTQYGTEVAAWYNLEKGKRVEITEARGSVRFLRFPDPIFQIAQDSATILRNGESGQELKFSPETAFVAVKHGILAWSPASSPKQAVLIETNTLKPLAAWKSEQ